MGIERWRAELLLGLLRPESELTYINGLLVVGDKLNTRK
jgi:hypothetical protein